MNLGPKGGRAFQKSKKENAPDKTTWYDLDLKESFDWHDLCELQDLQELWKSVDLEEYHYLVDDSVSRHLLSISILNIESLPGDAFSTFGCFTTFLEFRFVVFR